MGAKVDWDIWISDLVKKKTLVELIFNPCVEFRYGGPQLAKLALLTSTLVPLGSFQIF